MRCHANNINCNLSIDYLTFLTAANYVYLSLYIYKTDPKNFRPISLLPLTSKSIEKIIHSQTMEHLTYNKVLYRYQSGFCKNHLTDACLSCLTGKIPTGFDSTNRHLTL